LSRIDLHTHSSISDGLLTPRKLVELAAEEGLSTIALADHDTVDGIDEALSAGEEFGVEVIPAIEISVNHEDGSMHLLGYYIDHLNADLLEMLQKLKESREERNVKIIARLNELGYGIELNDVLALSTDGTCGRAHIAGALVARGYFPDVKSAFDALLNSRGPAYIDRYRLELNDAIDFIHHAGGAAVWAHPGNHADKMERMLDRLALWKGYGLDGIESDYCDHTIELRDRLRSLAREYGLIYTGGSDFHGSIKPQNTLGSGPEGSEIDTACLTQLRERVKYLRGAGSAL